MNNVDSIVKIGRSMDNPVDVINQWAVNAGIPGSANLAYAVLVENPLRVELDAHKKLNEFNTKGDWFRVTAHIAMSTIKSDKRVEIFEEKGSLVDLG